MWKYQRLKHLVVTDVHTIYWLMWICTGPSSSTLVQ